jgi:hypothetical protein
MCALDFSQKKDTQLNNALLCGYDSKILAAEHKIRQKILEAQKIDIKITSDLPKEKAEV